MKNRDDSDPHFQDQRSQSSNSRAERRSGALSKPNHESILSYKYVKAAVSRFFKSIFIGRKKNSSDRSVISTREANNSRREVSSFSTGSYGRNSSALKSYDSYGSYGSSSSYPSEFFSSPEFSIKDLYKATDNFSAANVVGTGSFGTVYKGKLKDGSLVAVKRAKRNANERCLLKAFWNEIQALSRIEHLNLVRLYGYLEQGDERIIIVEYVGNGNLREHLDGKRGDVLEIGERLDIAIDVAHAITYLHMYNDAPIIHRDIKATNILITEKLRAKVADFGFARLVAEDSNVTHISTQVKGTAGYLDPEYLRTYQLTEKSDVYSFGVLLVELITGRHPIETKRDVKERVTIRWAMQKLKDGEAVIAMDPRLRRTSASTVTMEKMLKLARRCLDPLRPSRPSMKTCCEELWGIRKEYRDRLLSSSCSESIRSAEFPGGNAKNNQYVSFDDKEDEDLYSKFHSV
ncbi:calmodulin-binding receptor-like cytoplasmic kinase 1 isoform X1 [Cucurbita pepo subsp. pepo]|uniref:calmodulin-binding receptor-like cytoplasmic kinase 1 isoform X1 n=1 Tax=Cucurbita pepo subsp. pepo TaxID=3664 RepID=UPI000C9D9C9B|nr:calmodulin-binding receptor-like cytoplasmic kinase 1 isoform X1 [Cucurbita pepo subsp. pepo]